jgi:uncharacterized protein YdaT
MEAAMLTEGSCANACIPKATTKATDANKNRRFTQPALLVFSIMIGCLPA